jgi:hypothetical protein
MLTDRQSKYVERLRELSKDDSVVTYKERVYLNRCINDLKYGMKFQDAINGLNLSLQGLVERKKKPLTKELEVISNELIEIYGKPDYRALNSLPNNSSILNGEMPLF